MPPNSAIRDLRFLEGRSHLTRAFWNKKNNISFFSSIASVQLWRSFYRNVFYMQNPAQLPFLIVDSLPLVLYASQEGPLCMSVTDGQVKRKS
ncbi:hypothetical protein NPIL_367721 [Nephila pilipes]|uniref:Uncharacterized protein n=1 Tax=Nephila pilipes TaxID=299642 RepID=A0A8X6Q2H7_NEPPI|nr:hypothetical protein NPIL_367721 [Nephila pilipes]